MSAPVRITDGRGTTRTAKVTPQGQLVVSPIAYDLVSTVELAETSTGYNFFPPKTNQQFVITGIRMRADRDVSPTADATVALFEGASATATVSSRDIWTENMVRGESVALFPTNILVSEGVWINGTTTDDDIFATVMGYYIEAL